MDGKGTGVSRARLGAMLRNNRAPEPVLPMPVIDLPNTTPSTDVQIVFTGLNFTKDTAVVLVADAADEAGGETAEVTGRVVVPSQVDVLGIITLDLNFANTPAIPTPNYYQLFLVGPNMQRTFLGTAQVV